MFKNDFAKKLTATLLKSIEKQNNDNNITGHFVNVFCKLVAKKLWKPLTIYQNPRKFVTILKVVSNSQLHSTTKNVKAFESNQVKVTFKKLPNKTEHT